MKLSERMSNRQRMSWSTLIKEVIELEQRLEAVPKKKSDDPLFEYEIGMYSHPMVYQYSITVKAPDQQGALLKATGAVSRDLENDQTYLKIRSVREI